MRVLAEAIRKVCLIDEVRSVGITLITACGLRRCSGVNDTNGHDILVEFPILSVERMVAHLHAIMKLMLQSGSGHMAIEFSETRERLTPEPLNRVLERSAINRRPAAVQRPERLADVQSVLCPRAQPGSASDLRPDRQPDHHGARRLHCRDGGVDEL